MNDNRDIGAEPGSNLQLLEMLRESAALGASTVGAMRDALDALARQVADLQGRVARLERAIARRAAGDDNEPDGGPHYDA